MHCQNYQYLYDSYLLINIRFPKDETIVKQWKEAFGFDTNIEIRGSICINHFSESDFIRKNDGVIKLKKGTIPSVNLLMESATTASITIQQSDHNTESTECPTCNEEIKRLKIAYSVLKKNHEIYKQTTEEKIKTFQTKITNLQKLNYRLKQAKRKVKGAILEYGDSQLNAKNRQKISQIFKVCADN